MEFRGHGLAGDDPFRPIEARFPDVLTGFGGSRQRLNLRTLMELYRVPALSVALVDGFRVQWARGYGVAEAGSGRPTTARTLFQAGSISKPVAAAAALRLVQSGRLRLDDDVNQGLTSWAVPSNEFTHAAPVTLRRLLSHTAGTTVHFYPGHVRGQPVPTLVQVLEGVPPANTDPVRVVRVPGSAWRYSGGGYLVAQQLMVDALGAPFPEIAQAQVFGPLGLLDSCFEQPLSEARAPAAASGTLATGEAVPGGSHIYPEMAAGGLWTTAHDLAEFGVRVVRAARGEDDRWLSTEIAGLMVTPQAGPTNEYMFGDAADPDQMGLGFVLAGASRPGLVGHLGDDAGFQALLQLSTLTGQGLAVMTNSDLGLIVAMFLRDQVYRAYGWGSPAAPSRVDPELLTDWLFAGLSGGTPAVRVAYQAARASRSGPASQFAETLIYLGYALAYRGRPQEAADVLALCVEENPSHWNAHDSLGEVQALLGDVAAAKASYRRSLELNPENANGRKRLAVLDGGGAQGLNST